jgi:hypothetical protein
LYKEKKAFKKKWFNLSFEERGYHMRNNSSLDSRIPCALTDNNIKLPILDITHPYFISSIDETTFRLKCAEAAAKADSSKKMPGFLKGFIRKMFNLENTYMSGMCTFLYKLGPALLKGRKIRLWDKLVSKQYTSMAIRFRLKEICRLQAEILMQTLKVSPEKNLCFINIAGGTAADNINTLILIQEEDSELLKGRKIEINILDLDSFGPNFAERCINVLKSPGQRFGRLDISVRIIPYDWSNSEKLAMLMQERSEWIQICSSEGGLFEYGSDAEIIDNLNQLYLNSPIDMKITGSLVFTKENVNPGFLAGAELLGINMNFLGLTGLKRILAQTKWVLESTQDIEAIYVVFTLRKRQ